jgi:ABC-type cobalamin/Fe3+-siderophores transport system ATPase subunit
VSVQAAPRTAYDASRAGGEVRLSIEQVSYAYSANPAQAPLFTLEATSFQARPGEILAILGPNASGKSTLLKLISGALEPLSGRVLLNGFATHSLSPRTRAQRYGAAGESATVSIARVGIRLAGAASIRAGAAF